MLPREGTKITQAHSQEEINETRHYCCMCGKAYPSMERDFYAAVSDLWAGRGGRLPFCKSCVTKMYKHYYDAYGGDERKAIRRVCMITDLYYSETVVSAIGKSGVGSQSKIARYITRLFMRQHEGKTYDTTIDEEKAALKTYSIFNQDDIDIAEIRGIPEIEQLDNIEALRERWGSGMKDEDYMTLEDHYKMLKRNNPNIDNNQEIFVKDLCTINLLKSNAMKDGDLDAFVKASEQYSRIFTKAGLKTVEENDSSSTDTLGVTLATIAKYTPEEFYKDKKLYEDYDELGEYYRRHTLRPLQNIINGTDIRDEEFFVPDEDEEEPEDDES